MFCHHAPEQQNILNNHKIYLYKTKQSLEAVITRPSPNPTTKIIIIDTAKIPQAQLTHIENALLHEQTDLAYPAYERLADALIHQNFPIKGYHEVRFTQAQTLEMLPPNTVNRHHHQIAINWLEYSPAYKRSCLESDLYLSPSPSASTASPLISTTDSADLSAMSKAVLFALDNTAAEPEQSMEIAPKITTKTTSISRKRKAPIDKSKSLSFTHQGIPWEFLGEGTYNKAYYNNGYVLKVSKYPAITLDTPNRSVRVFNEINPTLTKHAEQSGNYWVSPYIQGHEAPPQQQINYILETYARTGRLILDAYCKDNLLQDNANHHTICIDPGNAVRRQSIASEEHWYGKTQHALTKRQSYKRHMIKTIEKNQAYGHHEKTLPIFLIFALDYIDRKIAEQIHVTMKLKDNLLSLGKALYFYYAAQINPGKKHFILLSHTIDDILNNKINISRQLDDWLRDNKHIEVADYFNSLNSQSSPSSSMPFLQRHTQQPAIPSTSTAMPNLH
ncbi:hypothetical protein [Piscirickettsia salmonis]|uniref:hypothetical protein n=1 Tax=Piscirickettsia salmonis TaxID=1238 RepID=UPI0007C8BBAF|nr:hypothetical protein A0O36_02088 [Piscirickettsiaceae bacterium NZ-RLO1]